MWACFCPSSRENVSPLAQLSAQECRTTRSTSKPNSLCCASAAQLIWRCRRRCILGQTEAYLNKVTSILSRQPNHPCLKKYRTLTLPYNNFNTLFTNLVYIFLFFRDFVILIFQSIHLQVRQMLNLANSSKRVGDCLAPAGRSP